MLIPLGFLAAAGGGASGAMELISTVYGSGTASTITFSSIPNTYKHLQIRFTGRMAYSNTGLGLQMQFNGDTGSNYYWHALEGGYGSVYAAESGAGSTVLRPGWILGATADANAFTPAIVDILDYASSSKNKTIRSFTGIATTAPAPRVTLQSGVWFNTTAVSSISFSTAGNFVTGSRFSLYGIKG